MEAINEVRVSEPGLVVVDVVAACAGSSARCNVGHPRVRGEQTVPAQDL